MRDIVRELALEQLSRRAQVDRLRQLARCDAFPLPLNPRLRGGQRLHGPEAICAASLWDADSFDAWLHRPDPAAPTPCAALPAPPALRQQLAHRAQLVAGVRL